MTTKTGTLNTPLGPLHLTWVTAGGSPSTLCGARFEKQDPPVAPFLARHGLTEADGEQQVPEDIRERFDRYFAGEVSALESIPTLEVGTPFQIEVWRALREIPPAETRSYGEVARRVGRPRSFRAIGAANRANPIAVVVPCHRVIGANGTLTGYGGGLDRKDWLLSHERTHRQDS